MNEKIKNFTEYVSSDEILKAELQAELKDTEKENWVSNIIQFAKKHGHELTKEDFAPGCDELDDGELEAVVGGGSCPCPIIGVGNGDGLDCSCSVIGYGTVDNSYFPNSQGGCLCVAGGAGATRRH